jgi:hypothetical protein
VIGFVPEALHPGNSSRADSGARATRRIARLSSAGAMYAITRLKAARDAWYWAVHLKRRGKLHSKRFYDLKARRFR